MLTLIRAFDRAMVEGRIEDAQSILGELTLPRMIEGDIDAYLDDPEGSPVREVLTVMWASGWL